MLRLFGCLLMIAAGALCGITKASLLRQHTAELTKVISMLMEISELIRFKKSTTPEIIGSLSAGREYSDLIYCRSSCLNEEELTLLEDTLSKLGSTDSEGQISSIGYSVSRFERFREKAVDEESKKSRLYEVLGFMAGAFLAVIMI